jgi:hypothetical protein
MKTQYNKYLLGGNLDLVGSIIGIVKGIRRTKDKDPGYAILLYFDHRTARIERYLYNPNLKREEISYDKFLSKLEELENKKGITNKEIQDIFYYTSQLDIIAEQISNPILFSTEDYKIGSLLENKSKEELIEIFGDLQFYQLYALLDGKLNKRFYSTFYKELILSYFSRGKERKYYPNPNVTLIKYIERNDLLLMKAFERFSCYTDKAITNEIGLEFKPQFYLTEPKTGHLNQIYVPQNFTTELKSSDLYKYNKNYNFKFVPKKLTDCPSCILDLKSVINDNSINNYNDLRNNVDKCNEIIKKKLENM